MTILVGLAVTAAVILAAFTYQRHAGIWYSQRLPPGPRPKLFGLRKRSTLPIYKLFTLLNKQYGPVVSLFQGKTPVVVIGTIKAATDLLEKQGNIYSSRPRNIMAGEILSGGMRGIGMPYGPRWRNWRSLMHAGMGPEAAQNYKVLQSIESKILLRDLMEDKDTPQYSAHLRRFALSIVVCVAYGRRVDTADHPIVMANMKTDAFYLRMSTPGKYIVEAWPVLLKLPRFLQWFRYEAEAQRARDTETYLTLMNDVRRQMEAGLAQPSTARRGLEKRADFGLSDVEMAYTLSAPFGAGVVTTLATLEVFILAMLHYPDVMKKAQAEIDQIIGRHRMPEFDDLSSLPYISALIRETLRWKPVAPLGIPHSSVAENEYEDMYIPNGSTIFANIIGMSQDEAVFSSPEKFMPERYLETDKSSKWAQSNFYYGFGRRICPGMHVAQNSLFIVIARMLWAFNIKPSMGVDGRPVIPEVDDFTGGLVIRPRALTYSLALRGDEGTSDLIVDQSCIAEHEAQAWM